MYELSPAPKKRNRVLFGCFWVLSVIVGVLLVLYFSRAVSQTNRANATTPAVVAASDALTPTVALTDTPAPPSPTVPSTNTPLPTATYTPQPANTPSPTATLTPIATDTSTPAPTNTPLPPTATPLPTDTPLPPTSTPTPTAAWYSGGTLHDATWSEWKKATPDNKLATAADWITNIYKPEWQTEKQLRSLSEQLVKCVDDVADVSIQAWGEDSKVTDMVVTCVIEMMNQS